MSVNTFTECDVSVIILNTCISFNAFSPHKNSVVIMLHYYHAHSAIEDSEGQSLGKLPDLVAEPLLWIQGRPTPGLPPC